MDSSQRFFCTPAPHSSPLNTPLRSRKRSRASSAAGDSLAVNKEQGKYGNHFGSESKAHNSKDKVRLPYNNIKNSGKLPKTKRTSKKKLGSLQNAVVLAPFYTLKKSFQNKLINFYSFEKFKKMSYKTKMAKKRNMTFEYDIIELKPRTVNVKKEGKTTSKSNRKSKPTGYCRCKRNNEKADKKQRRSKPKLKRKTSGKDLFDSEPLDFVGHLENKRRKSHDERIFSPMTLKTEFSPRPNFSIPNGKSLKSDTTPSSLAMSSQSECDSWETFSNSPSSKEEYMEGAFAMSTSSFDCYLENFDKNALDLGCISRCNKPRNSQNTPEPVNTNLPEKPFRGCSRHLIFEKKSSDGRILGFMDREPQTQAISSEESHQHLQPLQLQSRPKDKKQESEPGCNCPSRPISSNKSVCDCHQRQLISKKGRVLRAASRASSQTERPEVKFFDENNKTKALQAEIGIQVEVITVKEEEPANLLKNSEQKPESAHSNESLNTSREKTPEEPFKGSNSSLSKVESPSQKDLPPDSETEPVKNSPSKTKIQPTETKENSSEESSNVETHLSDLNQMLSPPMP